MTDKPMTYEDDLSMFLWLRYLIATEEHDRTLPGMFHPRDHECWLPYDRGAMMRFARLQWEAMHMQAADLEIPPEIFSRQRSRAERLRYSSQLELAARLAPRFEALLSGEGLR